MVLQKISKISSASERARKDINIVVVIVALFLIFGAFLTMGNIQTVIIENAKDRNGTGYVEGFEGDGYISLSIVYAVSSVFDILAPSIIAMFGLKWSLVLSGLLYCVFISTFFFLSTALLYIGSFLQGVGNAVLWISNGTFLAVNSEASTIARNSGALYGLVQGMSGLVGNTYMYFQFRESYEIHPEDQEVFLSVLLAISLVGVAVNFLILPMPWADQNTSKPDTPLTSLTKCIHLLATPSMLILLPYFCYLGFNFSFRTGVYGPSLSFARTFDDADGDNHNLTGLHGIMTHTGMVISSVFCSVLGRKIISKSGHWPLVLTGIFFHCISYALVIINVPGEAPKGVTYDDALLIVPSRKA